MWWRDGLGFEITFVHRPLASEDVPVNYGVVARDDVEVHLARRVEISDRRRSEITIVVADLDGLRAELVGRDVPSHLGSECVAVHDPDGNRIVFSAVT